MSRCEGCGREVSDDSAYCSFCGTRQRNDLQASADEERQSTHGQFWRKCPGCGFNLIRGWEFCPACGTISRSYAGLKIVGLISLFQAYLFFSMSGYYFGYYNPVGRLFLLAMAVGFASVGLGLFLSRHPLIWWGSVTLWFLAGLEALLYAYSFTELYTTFVSAIIITYLAVRRRSFSILIM